MPVNVNGSPLISAAIGEPLQGFWVADVEIDTDIDLSGAQTIYLGGGVTFGGQVFRGGVDSGRWKGRIVAGSASRPSVTLAAKNYLVASVRTILGDILSASGDALDDSSDDGTLDGVRAQWQRSRGSVAKALQAVLGDTGANLRALRSGLLFFGEETFPALDVDLVEISRSPKKNSRVLAPEAPTLSPGVTFDGQRISYVTTLVGPQGLRQEVWFDG